MELLAPKSYDEGSLCQLANLEHFCAAGRASSGNGRPTVLQLDLFGVLDFARLFALDTVTGYHEVSKPRLTKFVFKLSAS